MINSDMEGPVICFKQGEPRKTIK